MWHTFHDFFDGFSQKSIDWCHSLLMCYVMTNGYQLIVFYPNFCFSFSFFAELENRLLSRFDAASQRRELPTMAECAKILSQVIFVSILM